MLAIFQMSWITNILNTSHGNWVPSYLLHFMHLYKGGRAGEGVRLWFNEIILTAKAIRWWLGRLAQRFAVTLYHNVVFFSSLFAICKPANIIVPETSVQYFWGSCQRGIAFQCLVLFLLLVWWSLLETGPFWSVIIRTSFSYTAHGENLFCLCK